MRRLLLVLPLSMFAMWNPILSVGSAVVAIVTGRIVRQRRRRARLDRRRTLISILEQVAGALGAGDTMQQSLTSALESDCGPWRVALGSARAHGLQGRRIPAAAWSQIDQAAEAVPDAFDVLAALGAPSAGVMLALANTVRGAVDIEEELVTATSQAELSALVVTLLPAGFFLFLAASGTTMLEQFLRYSVARPIVAVGVFLMLVAWVSMQSLIDRAHRG